jgi:hypothetical protein
MMEKSGPLTAGPIRPDAGNPSGKPLHGTRAGKRSFFHHPACQLVLVVGCLAVALPYVLAFAPPVLSGFAEEASQGLAAETTSPVDATFAAKAPLPETDSLQVVQSSFDPVLVERVESAGHATAADMLVATTEAPVVTVEMLRILAQMTPEQIDALTFLLLSQQDPKAAAASGSDPANALADDAPWVGDWTAGDLAPEQADPATLIEPLQHAELTGWQVFEASAEEAVIRNIDDPLSAVRVSPGTVLGNLGFVSEIRIDGGAAKVVLLNGDAILSAANVKIAPEASDPSEPRPGPPFEVASTEKQLVPKEPSAADMVASPRAVAEVAPARATVQSVQRPSTKSMQKDPPKQDTTGAGRYVQVATFRSAANAELAKGMLASDGLTGQLRETSQQGEPFHQLLAGPFEPGEIQKALGRVARLGFRDAFIIR